MCVLQESQAISLVSVAHVLGEAYPHKGLRRQPSHPDDLGSKKADAGQKQQHSFSFSSCSNVCVDISD